MEKGKIMDWTNYGTVNIKNMGKLPSGNYKIEIKNDDKYYISKPNPLMDDLFKDFESGKPISIDFTNEDLGDKGYTKTSSKRYKHASIEYDSDEDTDGDEYEMLLEELDSLIGDEEYFYVEGSNMGWTNADGYKYFTAKNSAEFIREILPRTNSFTMVVDKQSATTFKIKLSHHDSPTGESYIVHLYEKELKEKAKSMSIEDIIKSLQELDAPQQSIDFIKEKNEKTIAEQEWIDEKLNDCR